MDDYENITNQYEYHGMNITLPAEVVYELCPWSLAVVFIFIVFLFLYIGVWSELPKGLYRYLALEHLLTGCLHVTCLTFFNLKFSIPYLDYVLNETYSSLDLVITLTTACLSWIVFLRLFLFRNGEELYSLKELTIFSTLFIAIIESYEWLVSLIQLEDRLISALRLTSVLMIMGMPILVFMLLFKSLFSSSTEVPKSQALFFMAYLFMFIFSDGLLLRFNLICESSLIFLWTLFLYLRLVVEIVSYIVLDRYVSHVFE